MKLTFANRNCSCLLITAAAIVTIASVREARAQAAWYSLFDHGLSQSANRLPLDNLTTDSRDRGDDANRGGQRPIQDFLKAQGTTSGFYATPSAPNLEDYAVGWTTAPCPGPYCQYLTDPKVRIAVVDYAGGANKYLEKHGRGSLNTKTDGSITERLLPDGRAEVTVVLHTENALTFASTWNYSLPSPPQSAETNRRLFGSSVSDLIRDRYSRPALGDSVLVLTYKSPKLGGPMPDLVRWFALGQLPNLELISLYFSVDAAGTLPNGAPAKCHILQHVALPPPMLISGVLTSPVLLLDNGAITELVDIK